MLFRGHHCEDPPINSASLQRNTTHQLSSCPIPSLLFAFSRLTLHELGWIAEVVQDILQEKQANFQYVRRSDDSSSSPHMTCGITFVTLPPSLPFFDFVADALVDNHYGYGTSKQHPRGADAPRPAPGVRQSSRRTTPPSTSAPCSSPTRRKATHPKEESTPPRVRRLLAPHESIRRRWPHVSPVLPARPPRQ